MCTYEMDLNDLSDMVNCNDNILVCTVEYFSDKEFENL